MYYESYQVIAYKITLNHDA